MFHSFENVLFLLPSSGFILFPPLSAAFATHQVTTALELLNPPSPILWPLFSFPTIMPWMFLSIKPYFTMQHFAVCLWAMFFFLCVWPCLLLFCAPSVPHACRVSALALRVLLCVSGTHSLWLCQLCCEDGSTHIEVSSSDGNLIYVLRRVQWKQLSSCLHHPSPCMSS